MSSKEISAQVCRIISLLRNGPPFRFIHVLTSYPSWGPTCITVPFLADQFLSSFQNVQFLVRKSISLTHMDKLWSNMRSELQLQVYYGDPIYRQLCKKKRRQKVNRILPDTTQNYCGCLYYSFGPKVNGMIALQKAIDIFTVLPKRFVCEALGMS